MNDALNVKNMLSASCHCGRIQIKVPAPSAFLIDCNCSICRRYGALWACYSLKQVEIIGHPEHSVAYLWGKQSIQTMHCAVCGCVTHWEALSNESDRKMAVNARNFEAGAWIDVPIRHFDGADSWTFLD